MAKRIRGKNEGSLSQRSNGRWRVQISDKCGRRISRDFKTKQVAQAWLRQMQEQLNQGYDYQASKIPLGKYLQQWLEDNRTTLRDTTAHQYQLLINKHIIPRIGDVPVKELNLARIERFYREMIEAGVGIRTIRYNHAILHKALAKAVYFGLVLPNPAHEAALPRLRQSEMQILDESQISLFLIASASSKYHALYHLAITTGLREGELFGLRWSDLQWTSGVLHVQRQLQKLPRKGWSFVEPKTRAGRRSIQLGEGALQVLREHKLRQEQQKLFAGSSWQEHNLIFPCSVGTPSDPSNLRKDFLRILEQAGLPKLRFHDLRHTAASLLLNHNVPVIVVSNMLGHSKPSVTLDVYGHLMNGMQGEAARIMDALVTPIPVNLTSKVHQDVSLEKP